MNWNKIAVILFEMALAAYFFWCWRDAGKTGVVRIQLYSVDREKEPRGFLIVRWLLLAFAALFTMLTIFVLIWPA